MRRVCVFCGSNLGANPLHRARAADLGALLVRRGIALVYGGGNIGLMGVLADTVIERGGEVIGVIPHGLVEREVAHTGLPDLRVVGSMHERKALMAELADGFVALPGGLGTLEEFFEILTWKQLGVHAKPCGLLNVNGYFDHLLTFLDACVRADFLRPDHRGLVVVEEDPERLLERMAAHHPAPLRKWMGSSTT